MSEANNHLHYNVQSCDREDGMSYIDKPTQQMRIRIAVDQLKAELGEGRGQQLLSIGCCTGDIEVLFKQMGLIVHGVDGAEVALKEAAKKGVITKKADVSRRLPYAAETFDFVFAGEIIEHIMHTRVFLSEIHRVLKKGGVVIITTPNLARIEDRIRFLFGRSPKHTTPIHDYLYLHIRPFTADSLRRALRFCGFDVLAVQSNYVYLGGLRAGRLSRMLAHLFPELGKTLIVKARKNYERAT